MKALLCVLGSLLLRELYADDWLTVGRAFQPLDCSKPRPRGVQCDEETNACYAGAFSALVSPGTSQLLREKNALRPRYVELISALERETTNSKFAPDRALATSLRSLFLEADTPSELRTAGSAVVASLEAQLARKDATGRLRVARLACDVAPLLPRSWSGEAAFWSQNRPREDDRDRPRTPEEDLALRARMAPAGYTPAPALLLRAFDEEVAALQREKRILSSPVIDAVKEAVLDCRPLLFPGVHPGVGRQDTAPVVWAMNAWERVLTEWCDTPGLGVGGVKIGIDTGDEPRSAGGAGLAGGRFGSVLSAFDRSSSVSWASLRGAWNYITGGGGGGSDVDVGEQYHSVPGPYNRLAALADGFHELDTNKRALFRISTRVNNTRNKYLTDPLPVENLYHSSATDPDSRTRSQEGCKQAVEAYRAKRRVIGKVSTLSKPWNDAPIIYRPPWCPTSGSSSSGKIGGGGLISSRSSDLGSALLQHPSSVIVVMLLLGLAVAFGSVSGCGAGGAMLLRGLSGHKPRKD